LPGVGDVLLFGHLLSAFALVAGAATAGILQLAAGRRRRPSEVALLLRTTRPAVLLVVVGLVGTLGFGIALARHQGRSLGETWISAALALWVVALVTGELGGRSARHARRLAERLAAEGDRPSDELRELVSHRPALLLSYASAAAILAIVVLMVWKPGS
jgi:uncharacterized membrane protein